MHLWKISGIREEGCESMAVVECKNFLAKLKQSKKDIDEWIDEHGEGYQELTEKLNSELIPRLDIAIEVLELMEPGSLVEVG